MSADTSSFRLYNTKSRSVEPVRPLREGQLRFYACGPTVYSYAHIGNFRSFLTSDLILRTARAIGWDVLYATNITDVGHLTEDDYADAGGEDRMVRALQSKEGEQFANIFDLARYYADVLLDDWKALNLREPSVRPRATEHVTDQIAAVERLIAAGQVSLSVIPTLARNGRPVTLRGSVGHPGTRIPKGGKLVSIQFLDPARRRWRPVEMLRTNQRGRFVYRYRFRTISYAQRIIFRAVAVGEAGWPFRTAHTAGRSVLVYPD